MSDDRKDLVKKKLECGWTLHICREPDPDSAEYYYSVWLENTVGSTEHDIDIERPIDMKNIGEAFLKAYERRKKKCNTIA